MTFDRGWTSQFFITNQESQTAEFDNPYILLCNSKISNFSTLANVIKDVVQAQKPLVIIAESFDNTVIQGLAMNINPIFNIGKSSLTSEFTESINETFNNKELIKISVLKNCIDDPMEIAKVLGRDEKSTDNALSRLKSKLRKVIE